MTVRVIETLHLVEDPGREIAGAAAGADRLIVRVPDRGTAGNRALREADVGRMLLAHGRILELATTEDGTILAACEPCRRRGEIAVWTGQAIGPWHPSDIVQRGLGGSETAAVRLAEQLARMGWTVTLYGHFDQAGIVGDVALRHFLEYDDSRPHDALICFRDARRLDDRPNARFVALWLEDLAPAEQLTRARAANLDRICAVSHWHKQQVQQAHPWLAGMTTPDGRDLVAACRNGIVPGWFAEQPPPDREPRVIYSSSPDRGGDVMLELWPQVRARVPDAELVLTYSRWFDRVADVFQGAHDLKARIYELLEQPGVHRIEGGLGQRALANLMRSSRVWAHPSFNSLVANEDGSTGAPFHETSCISAMEAQAAGCVVVASNWGAVTETVQHGTLVDGDPREPDGAWRRTFVEAIVAGLTDRQVQETAAVVGPEMVRHMDWAGAAEQLAAMIPAGERDRVVDEDSGMVPMHHPV